jgi:hypothetical protein
MKKSFAQLDKEFKGTYIELLSVISKLSGLFSESLTPFINYRIAENVFCQSFNAKNLSRSDTAFDADYNSIGIGLKTFICQNNTSNEKIAEFNSLALELSKLNGYDLAIKLSQYRNDRIELAKRLYHLNSSLYHIVARREKEILLFETDYDIIDINKISKKVKSTKAGIQFDDGKNEYSFNFSKSTLYRKFEIPTNVYKHKIEIIKDPYSILLELFKGKKYKQATDTLIKGVNYVILPLYGYKKKQKFVHEKSGLNQWNANGRKRDFGEIYIPIPINIHKKYPDFFPARDQKFNLKIPTGENFSAKVCQENSKALMTDPNKAMSDWLLRNVLSLKEGDLATIELLKMLDVDSVIIIKDGIGKYSIDVMKADSYENFLLDE